MLSSQRWASSIACSSLQYCRASSRPCTAVRQLHRYVGSWLPAPQRSVGASRLARSRRNGACVGRGGCAGNNARSYAGPQPRAAAEPIIGCKFSSTGMRRREVDLTRTRSPGVLCTEHRHTEAAADCGPIVSVSALRQHAAAIMSPTKHKYWKLTLLAPRSSRRGSTAHAGGVASSASTRKYPLTAQSPPKRAMPGPCAQTGPHRLRMARAHNRVRRAGLSTLLLARVVLPPSVRAWR
jgi:hypothetical protein